MSKIQITRFTSTLIFFIFIGAVFFNGAGATNIPGHYSQCDTGPVQCCQQSFDSNSYEAKNLLALDSIGLGILSGMVCYSPGCWVRRKLVGSSKSAGVKCSRTVLDGRFFVRGMDSIKLVVC